MSYKITNDFSNSVNNVWNELVKLDYFLQNKFIDWMNQQVVLETDSWTFVHEPMAVIEKEKFNLPMELYEFSYTNIFIDLLIPGFNKAMDLLRELPDVRKRNEHEKEKYILDESNRIFREVRTTYSKNVFKFREMANGFLLKKQPTNKIDSNPETINKSKLKETLSKGNASKVLRDLFGSLKGNDDKYNQLVNLSSRLSMIEMDYRMGTISDDYKNIEYSKICIGLLSIIDEI